MPAMVLSIIKHCLHVWFPPIKTKATFISFGLHFPNQNKAQASLFSAAQRRGLPENALSHLSLLFLE